MTIVSSVAPPFSVSPSPAICDVTEALDAAGRTSADAAATAARAATRRARRGMRVGCMSRQTLGGRAYSLPPAAESCDAFGRLPRRARLVPRALAAEAPPHASAARAGGGGTGGGAARGVGPAGRALAAGGVGARVVGGGGRCRGGGASV